MRSVSVIVLLSVLLAAFVEADDDLRLIQLSEDGTPKWLTSDQVRKLAVSDVGFMDITDHQTVKRRELPTPPPLPNQPQQKSVVSKLIEELDVGNMKVVDDTLASFPTRYYTTETGREAAQYIHDTLAALKGGRDDITLEYFNHEEENPRWIQPSVIARFQGSVEPSQIVILGSHEDSISLFGDAPGADDDGSGSSTNVEVFRVLAQSDFRPNRTVEFHWYSAEEAGLLGSQAVSQQYYEQEKNVVSMLQLDMTYYKGPDVVGIVTDFTEANLTQFIRECVEAYSLIPWEDTICGYGCSDHASWEKLGYRAAFPFETPFPQRNPYIHTKNDTPDKLDLEHGLEFAKFALGYVVEMAATEYFPLQ